MQQLHFTRRTVCNRCEAPHPAAVSATTEGTLIGAPGTTTEVSEMTGAVGTRGNGRPQRNTFNDNDWTCPRSTTELFFQGCVTAVKPHDPAAVANGTAPRAPESWQRNNRGFQGGRKAYRKVAVRTISAVKTAATSALPMFFEGPRQRSGHTTTAHPEISERRAPRRKGRLNGRDAMSAESHYLNAPRLLMRVSENEPRAKRRRRCPSTPTTLKHGPSTSMRAYLPLGFPQRWPRPLKRSLP